MTRPALALCVAAASIGSVLAQSRTPAPPRGQVLVHVLVTAADGTEPISGLDRGDFEALSDGRPVRIQSFTEGPHALTGVVLLDASASVPATINGPSGFFPAAIEDSFVGALTPRDRMRIGSFARRLTLSPEFTVARLPLVDAARRAVALPDEDRYGPSPLWDAIDAALAALEPEPGRKAIFVVTDGKSTGNTRGLEPVMRRAMLSDTAICIVGEGPTTVFRQTKAPDRASPEIRLAEIANRTGCLYVADGLANLGFGRPVNAPLFKTGQLLADLLESARMTYALGFAPPADDGADHALEVRVKLRRMHARARRVYR